MGTGTAAGQLRELFSLFVRLDLIPYSISALS